MNDLLKVGITLGIVFIGNLFFKEKKGFLYYWIMGVILFIGLTVINKIYADFVPDAQREIAAFTMLIDKGLSDKDRKYYENKRDFHLSNAERCYGDAKNKCWYLPDITDRDKAKYCFSAIIVLVAPGHQPSKMILGLLSLLGSYGVDCIDEWNIIEDKLKWSAYHYEMYEFYRDILNSD